MALMEETNTKGYTPLQVAMERGYEQIFLFLLEQGGQFTTRTSQGKVLDCLDPSILEEYFNKSNSCIQIDKRKNTMKLCFNIFSTESNIQIADHLKETQYVPQQSPDAKIPSISLGVSQTSEPKRVQRRDSKKADGRSLLSLLVSQDMMQPLCKHPFISAFLDIHYSPLKKLRTQVKDSVAHMTMIMLLLALSATIRGSAEKNFEYLTGLGCFLCLLMMSLDLLSIIGLHTTWIDRLFQGSLVRDRYRKSVKSMFPKTKTEWMHLLLHPIGYMSSITALMCGIHFHCNFSENEMKARKEWKLGLEIMMLVYSTLLAVKEAVQIANSKFRLYFRRDSNKIDLIAIIATMFIVVVSIVHCQIEKDYPPWMFYLILTTVLIIWFQMCTDILQSLPLSDVEQYLNMYLHVARSYFAILLCFSPFFIAFAVTFKCTYTYLNLMTIFPTFIDLD